MGKFLLKYGLVRCKSEDSEYCKRSGMKKLNTEALIVLKNVCFGNEFAFECFGTPHTITCSCANPFLFDSYYHSIIKSVSFQNFYNYYGSFDNNTYRFKEGINIVNADNNVGKSKFYNDILWLLKDEVYDSDSKKTEQAKTSFSKMVSGKAKSEETEFDMVARAKFGPIRFIAHYY